MSLRQTDLTRWNRAGMRRFDYVDGDAAVWLERLREILTGLYAKGLPADMRAPDALRDLFLSETSDLNRSEVDIDRLRKSLVWQRLARAIPPSTEDGVKLESRGQRGLRLRAQYQADSDGDYAWDILRAFARASHVTLGHLDAFANEGYLRTATQWDNLRRMAALVNYQPTPAASASTLVALELKPDLGAVEVAAGMAMKHTPATGKPLVFETLGKLLAHPALNGVRVSGWDVNGSRLPGQDETWLNPSGEVLSPGEEVVITGGGGAQVRTITGAEDVSEDADASLFELRLNQALQLRPTRAQARLWRDPADILRPLPRSEGGSVVVQLEDANALRKADLVELRGLSVPRILRVTARDEDRVELALPDGLTLPDAFELVALTPLAAKEPGIFHTPTAQIDRVFYTEDGVVKAAQYPSVFRRRQKAVRGNGLDGLEVRTSGVTRYRFEGKTSGYIFELPKIDTVFIQVPGEKSTAAKLIDDPKVTKDDGANVASFRGAMPKGLKPGAVFILRSRARRAQQALRVKALRQDKGLYHIAFDQAVSVTRGAEFVGPMRDSLRPLDHDRNPDTFGTLALLTFCDVPDEALDILRPGRPLIVSDGAREVQAQLATIKPLGGEKVEVTLSLAGSIADFTRGDTVFMLNAVIAGHGESKGPKTIGSGDGEQMRQSFLFQVADVSHVASPVSESGVIPAMDIAVDGELWTYSDFIDPAMDGTNTWSTTLGEDGYLTLHFRRRLPTGSGNVTALRHRVGVGAAGSAVPAFSFVEPSKKHPYVKSVFQPFATSGGADREPVESLRATAPARLSSNGRAVSLRDFEKLTMRHAAVWRARAAEDARARRARRVTLSIVPAGGGDVSAQLKLDLGEALGARALPGVTLDFRGFEPLYLRIHAQVRADLTARDATDIQAACDAALRATFALEARDFGQPAYISEAIAALEAVPGVATTIVTTFDYGPDTPDKPPRVMTRDDQVVTIYPTATEVAHVGENSVAAALPGAPSISIDVRGLHE
ncbi:hypothetical protein C8N43_0761 [Litoreibacter ponti]|uniref:Phage baseplate assembly protein n=1 Tax=Litoreibacter ponti TaxID=1510457 RepID=A0A2T6BJ75_9RHOB|nr:hypothetical protein [Litoreibacter ponti]PTX56110.1 hypothetical protein C8N43_0761 [Litoreibacter ponti]